MVHVLLTVFLYIANQVSCKSYSSSSSSSSLIFEDMPQRGYVLVFFLWALIAIITPTLVSLSLASKKTNMEASQGGARIEVKVRRMMVLLEKTLTRNTSSSSSSSFTEAPTPAPAPTMVAGNGTHR
ncbi:uncharacterized protein LOC120280070 [Dioscorea cayenensis subsp. rotundata]|uniref:Uncharacterized protein LOC120280070 n=1 Tax=Dioscorea cayennensis subsp. rotundata TaxID=55577 RepID=A0AB40CTG0_DIOCR|nr:uncharacterized protein LOC120280070 [Dioscorea cayenensis subsp. rotundata]